MNKNTVYYIWLSLIFSQSYEDYISLLENFDGAEDLFLKGKDALHFGSFSKPIKAAFDAQDLYVAKTILKECENKSIGIITYEDEDYPESLKYISNPPLVLYCFGDISLLKNPLITLTGQRHCNDDGKRYAANFIKAFETSGISIVTGFAPGIETTVMKKCAKPIVILPCSFDRLYPKSNTKYFEKVLKNGGLVLSEYPLGTPAYKQNFRFRNRLLAGISDSTLFVQAGERSGTSMTFGYCSVYNKTAYAVPGDITSSHYQGSNNYIREGAILVTSPEQIVFDYYMKYPELVNQAEKSVNKSENIDFDLLTEDEAYIIKVIDNKTMYIDDICENTGISARIVNSSLINLEILGIIEKCEGNRYKIK